MKSSRIDYCDKKDNEFSTIVAAIFSQFLEPMNCSWEADTRLRNCSNILNCTSRSSAANNRLGPPALLFLGHIVHEIRIGFPVIVLSCTLLGHIMSNRCLPHFSSVFTWDAYLTMHSANWNSYAICSFAYDTSILTIAVQWEWLPPIHTNKINEKKRKSTRSTANPCYKQRNQ